jgi:hypothetical protein
VTTTAQRTTVGRPIGTVAPVVVTFDQPGATPRPIRETVRPIGAATQELRSEVRAITYRGLACGFTFRGTRPPGPVTIRVQGISASGRFDSGPLAVAWDRAGLQTEAAAATRTGWSFGAAANPNRNGPGYVVSAGGIPPEGSPLPTSAVCTLRTSGAARFAPANGPVGYWAGFATN